MIYFALSLFESFIFYPPFVNEFIFDIIIKSIFIIFLLSFFNNKIILQMGNNKTHYKLLLYYVLRVYLHTIPD